MSKIKSAGVRSNSLDSKVFVLFFVCVENLLSTSCLTLFMISLARTKTPARKETHLCLGTFTLTESEEELGKEKSKNGM